MARHFAVANRLPRMEGQMPVSRVSCIMTLSRGIPPPVGLFDSDRFVQVHFVVLCESLLKGQTIVKLKSHARLY